MRIIANRFPTKCRETKKEIEYGDICLYDYIKKCVYHLESIAFHKYELKNNVQF